MAIQMSVLNSLILMSAQAGFFCSTKTNAKHLKCKCAWVGLFVLLSAPLDRITWNSFSPALTKTTEKCRKSGFTYTNFILRVDNANFFSHIWFCWLIFVLLYTKLIMQSKVKKKKNNRKRDCSNEDKFDTKRKNISDEQ